MKNTSKNVRNRILRGISTNAFGILVTIIIQIIGVPIFLKYWGVSIYGEWILISTIPTYLMLSDIGLSSVIANEMTVQVSLNNRNEALKTFQNGWIMICIISTLVVSLLIGLFWSLPFEEIFKLNQTHKEISLIVTYLSLNVIVSFQTTVATAGFRCENEYAIGSLYYSFIRLFSFLILIGCVILGFEPSICALGQLISNLFGASIMIFHLITKYSWIKYGYNGLNFGYIKKLFKPSIAFMSFPLGDSLNLQGTILIIGFILSPTQVVIFSTLRTLSRIALLSLTTISKAVWPEMSIALSQKDFSLARTLHRNACKLSIWISIILIMLLLAQGKNIVQLWTDGNVQFESTVFRFLLLLVFINSLWTTSLIVPMSINKHEYVAIQYLISTTISILLMYPLTVLFGLTGSVLSLLIIDIFMLSKTIKTSIDITGDNINEYLLNIFKV